MANSGFNAEFLRAWQNEDNDSIDAVCVKLNKGITEDRNKWDKKKAQKEAARYRKEGVNLRKFSRQALEKIDGAAAATFLASLTTPSVGVAEKELGDTEE